METSFAKEFIIKAISVYGDRYDYSLVEYRNQRMKVKIKCRLHGVFEQRPCTHLSGMGCKKCGWSKRNQTMLDRYGGKSPFQSKEIRKLSQTKEAQEKRKQTNLKRYGVEYSFQSKSIQEKIKQTNLKRYGAKNPSQSTEVKGKRERTWLKTHGVKHPSQKHYSIDSLAKLNSYEFLYGEYIDHNKTSKQISEELKVDATTVCNYLRHHGITIFQIANFSKLAIQWLEAIIEREGIFIQHAGNIGEFSIPDTRLVVDGYCKETNTVYEFHGDCWHGNLEVFKGDEFCHPFSDLTAIELYNRTLERENRIKSLGYNLIIMWERNYINV